MASASASSAIAASHGETMAQHQQNSSDISIARIMAATA